MFSFAIDKQYPAQGAGQAFFYSQHDGFQGMRQKQFLCQQLKDFTAKLFYFFTLFSVSNIANSALKTQFSIKHQGVERDVRCKSFAIIQTPMQPFKTLVAILHRVLDMFFYQDSRISTTRLFQGRDLTRGGLLQVVDCCATKQGGCCNVAFNYAFIVK
ncbi:MAG: hypothetical protein PHV80_07250 [Rugosibacter sp.]|nr:hypothetical protein [Rugosibacter sp.]